MSLTILIDLDGTLLSNNIDNFIPVYLEALSRHLYPIPQDLIIREIMSATRKMVENQSPIDTLENIFESHFYPAIGTTRIMLQDKIESFYGKIYPTLRQYTHQKPGVIEFINKSFKQGYQVAIATNPVFPRTATLQRLHWAGLSQEEYPYSIISTYESFHFAKPSPVYYAELLGQLGWPVDPVVMIGNDFEMDIQPAGLLNVPTFLLNELESEFGEKPGSTSRYGDISSLTNWINEVSSKNVGSRYQDKEAIQSIIKSTPAVIHTFIKDLPNQTWTFSPQTTGWSINEIIEHLANEEKNVHIPSIKKFLSHENLIAPEKNTDQSISNRENYHLHEISEFHEYIESRVKLIHILEKIPDHEWKRSAISDSFSNTTLLELCGMIASHDQNHIRQIKQMII
jgi:FMN phosphatase YigB (HAD superfamily)